MGVSNIQLQDLISASHMEVKYPSALLLDAHPKPVGVMQSGAVKIANAMVQNQSYANSRIVPTTIKGGVCIRHGAKRKNCKFDDCNNKVKKGGVCRKHGAKETKCKFKDCTNNARKGGICRKHGAKATKCKFDDCNNNARKGGVCYKHGSDV